VAPKASNGEDALRLAASVLLAGDLGFDPKVDTQLWEPTARAIFGSWTGVDLRQLEPAGMARFVPPGPAPAWGR
jgi:hypothetical protein